MNKQLMSAPASQPTTWPPTHTYRKHLLFQSQAVPPTPSTHTQAQSIPVDSLCSILYLCSLKCCIWCTSLTRLKQNALYLISQSWLVTNVLNDISFNENSQNKKDDIENNEVDSIASWHVETRQGNNDQWRDKANCNPTC